MDVLGMYLLQRISDELAIQRYGSFENRFVTPIPDNAAAKAAHESYVSASKEIQHGIRQGDF